MTETIGLFLAGLGLFFTGVDGVRAKLQELSSRRFRGLLTRLTGRPVLAAAAGAAFGALTQSATAVAFIVSGMVATGLITLRRGLLVVAAANLGTAVLVFLVARDFKLAVFYLVGVTGLMLSFKVASRHDALIGAIFGVGILFLGLDLMKRAVDPLSSSSLAHGVVAFLNQWTIAPFIAGAASRMVIQSSSTVAAVTVALQHAGLLNAREAVLVICGTGPGVALSIFFLSTGLRGAPRQVLYWQGVINAIGGTVLAIVVLAGGYDAIVKGSPMAAGDQVKSGLLAWTYLACMGLTTLVGVALLPVAATLLERWSPSTAEEDLSRPEYLHDEALNVPDTALDLADNEQRRLFSIVVQVLDSVRSEAAGASRPPRAALSRAGTELARLIDRFLGDLVDQSISRESASRLLVLDRRQDHLEALLAVTGELATASIGRDFAGEPATLIDQMKESLSFIFLEAQEAWASRSALDLELLLQITGDRGDVMESLRRGVSTAAASNAEVSAVSLLTSQFERAVWLVRQIGLTLA